MKHVAIPLIAFIPVHNFHNFKHDLPDLFQALEAQAVQALSGVGNGDTMAFVAEDFQTTVIEPSQGHELAAQIIGTCPPVARHYIVSGRIPFDDEDSTVHLALEGDASAKDAFVRWIYDQGDPDALPADWKDTEQPGGEPWAIINAVIEISGPPVSFNVQ